MSIRNTKKSIGHKHDYIWEYSVVEKSHYCFEKNGLMMEYAIICYDINTKRYFLKGHTNIRFKSLKDAKRFVVNHIRNYLNIMK